MEDFYLAWAVRLFQFVKCGCEIELWSIYLLIDFVTSPQLLWVWVPATQTPCKAFLLSL
jgi:hypothetical protein